MKDKVVVIIILGYLQYSYCSCVIRIMSDSQSALPSLFTSCLLEGMKRQRGQDHCKIVFCYSAGIITILVKGNVTSKTLCIRLLLVGIEAYNLLS